MAQRTVLLPGHWDSPGTAGAAPCPRVEMSRRCWSDILWLQTRAPRGQGRGRHSRDGFPGSIVRTERRKQLGATPAHFQGSGVPPVAMLPHKSLWRESTSAQISCPPASPAPLLHQLRRRSLWPRPPAVAEIPGQLLGGPPLHTPDSRGAPHHQRCKSSLGAKQDPGSIPLRAGSTGWHGAPARASLGQMSHRTQPPPPNAMPRHAGKGRASAHVSASHRAHAGPALLAGSHTYTLSLWQDAPLKPTKFKPAVQHSPGRAD